MNRVHVHSLRQEGERNLTPSQCKSLVPHLQNKQLLSALMNGNKRFLARFGRALSKVCLINLRYASSKIKAPLKPLTHYKRAKKDTNTFLLPALSVTTLSQYHFMRKLSNKPYSRINEDHLGLSTRLLMRAGALIKIPVLHSTSWE